MYLVSILITPSPSLIHTAASQPVRSFKYCVMGSGTASTVIRCTDWIPASGNIACSAATADWSPTETRSPKSDSKLKHMGWLDSMLFNSRSSRIVSGEPGALLAATRWRAC